MPSTCITRARMSLMWKGTGENKDGLMRPLPLEENKFVISIFKSSFKNKCFCSVFYKINDVINYNLNKRFNENSWLVELRDSSIKI